MTASAFTRFTRTFPSIAGAMVVCGAGVSFATSRPLLLESKASLANQHVEANKTLSFPRSMLFAKQLTVTKVEQVNYNTKKITFALPGGSGEVSGVPAGGAILIQHTPAGRWFPVLRPYTPINDPGERGLIQLLVKQYPNGTASTYIHSLRPGQELTVRGPLPGYSWTPLIMARDVLFVAGGAGITPIYSLTKSILSDPNDKARIQLVWGVNGKRDIVLKSELESLEKQYPERLRVTYCVSSPEGLDAKDDEGKYKKGYIDQFVLQEAIQPFKSESWGDQNGTKVFICGPPAMQDVIAGSNGILHKLGVKIKDVHKF